MGVHYTEEFRSEAVRLVIESKKTVEEVAKDLGMNSWTLRGWMQKRRNNLNRTPEEAKIQEALEEEIRQLKRENSILKQERDILKKAAAYFAKDQL